ncbi:hypothetical protein [Micromonospora sp. NPDC003776]
MGKKVSPQKKADRALCPVQVANMMRLKVHEVAAVMRAAGVIEQLTPQHAREWMKDPVAAPRWFVGLLAESAARQAQRIAREEREELERRHKLVIVEEKVTRRLLAGAKHFRSPEEELIASDMAFRASKELVRAHTGACGEVDPQLLSDLDIAALRWAGVDLYDHSTWAVHRGDCGR